MPLQPRRDGRVVGQADEPGRADVGGARASALLQSQRLQVGEHVLQLRRRQSRRRHARAGLDALADRRSSRRGCRACSAAMPAASVCRVIRWVRSGPSSAAGLRAAHGVAGAAARGEHRRARLQPWRPAGGRRRLQLVRAPGREVAGRVGDDHERHVRVLRAAELGALAAVDARAVGLQPGDVGLAGDDVGLAGQLRDPEGVDHVRAGQLDAHRPADRDVDLVGGGEGRRLVGVAVADAPPPLVRRHLEGQVGRRAGMAIARSVSTVQTVQAASTTTVMPTPDVDPAEAAAVGGARPARAGRRRRAPPRQAEQQRDARRRRARPRDGRQAPAERASPDRPPGRRCAGTAAARRRGQRPVPAAHSATRPLPVMASAGIGPGLGRAGRRARRGFLGLLRARGQHALHLGRVAGPAACRPGWTRAGRRPDSCRPATRCRRPASRSRPAAARGFQAGMPCGRPS